MDIVTIAAHIATFLYVLAPVATFFLGINHGYLDSVYLMAGRINIIAGYPQFPGVLDAGHKIPDILLFLNNSLALFNRVGNAFFLAEILPVAVVDLNQVLDR